MLGVEHAGLGFGTAFWVGIDHKSRRRLPIYFAMLRFFYEQNLSATTLYLLIEYVWSGQK